MYTIYEQIDQDTCITYTAYSAGYMDYALDIVLHHRAHSDSVEIFHSPHYLSCLDWGVDEDGTAWDKDMWQTELIDLAAMQDTFNYEEFLNADELEDLPEHAEFKKEAPTWLS